VYGSETWAIKGQGKSSVAAEGVKFWGGGGGTAKYRPFDHNRNQDILKELKRQSDLVQINNSNNKGIQHVSRVGRHRLMQAVIKYQPAAEMNTGRPLTF
jgi:hypothetical protein